MEASLANDPELDRAIELLNDPATYAAILDGSYADQEKVEEEVIIENE